MSKPDNHQSSGNVSALQARLVVAVTGATGAYAAHVLMEKSPWPVQLVISRWGRDVYERECGNIAQLGSGAETVFANDDLAAPISSGSVPTVGMIILPCSANTLAKIAAGLTDSLITRAAHCHLKEQRKLVLCVRESPWTLIDINNASRVAAAGGIIMPLSPPYYMGEGQSADSITMADLMRMYVDRVLALLGEPAPQNWGSIL